MPKGPQGQKLRRSNVGHLQLEDMHKAARLIGLLWIAAAVIGGLLFLAASIAAMRPNLLHNSRAVIILIFFAALPGVLIYRWGKAGCKITQ